MLLNQSRAVSSGEEKNTASDTHFITAVMFLCVWEWVRTGDKAREQCLYMERPQYPCCLMSS